MCVALGQHRSTQRKTPRGRDDEEALTADIIELARQYGRYGYRKITALLRDDGWVVNAKRVERIWRREGLKVPAKQPKRGRLWLNDGSYIRLRPEHRDHVWSYDFVEDRTYDGRKFRTLNVVDEFTRECLAIRVARKLNSTDVIDVLSDLFILRGVPGYVRSDNGSEFIAQAVQDWIEAVGAKTAYIAPGSPWGERLCRVVQCSASGRTLRWRELLLAARSAGHHRKLAAPLQHRASTRLNRLSAAGARGVCARLRRMAGYAIPTSFTGHAHASTQTNPELTFDPDHPVGADQVGASARGLQTRLLRVPVQGTGRIDQAQVTEPLRQVTEKGAGGHVDHLAEDPSPTVKTGDRVCHQR